MLQVRPEEIFEALFDDEAFERLPTLLAEIGGGRSALMTWRHHDGGFEILGHSYFTPELAAGLPKVLARDPWMVTALERPNRTLRLDEFVSTKTVQRSAPYDELIRPLGDDTAQCMGVVLSSGWGVGSLSVQRGLRQPQFDADDSAHFDACLGHFVHVLRLRGEIAAARRAAQLAADAADTQAVAMVTVARDRRILTANAAALAVFARNDGLGSREGRLTAALPKVGERLEVCVGRATAASRPTAGAFVVERPGEARPYLVTVAPVIAGCGAATALVVFRDPEWTDATLADRLRSLFGLTAAEAAVAVEVAAGRPPAEIQARRKVAAGTVSTQLKSVMEKTGCKRQAEIAAVVAALPPLRSG